MSALDSSQISSSSEPVREWQERIKQIQLQRVTPEVLASIRDKAERTKKAKASVKTASRLERMNYLTTMTNARVLQEYDMIESNSSGPFQSATAMMSSMTTSADIYRKRNHTLQTIMHSGKVLSRVHEPVIAAAAMDAVPGYASEPLSAVVVNDRNEDLYEFDEEEENVLRSLEQEVGVDDVMCAMAAQPSISISEVQQVEAAGIDELLRQLIHEPVADEELAAKYLLFENFLETVTSIRNTTTTFWTENMDQFDGASRVMQQKMIDRIDATENISIPDDSSKWFVYHMTKQANQNSKSISSILSSIKGKLNILLQDLGDCPFCLDQMTKESVVTLSCCHRSCKSCWDNWVALRGPRAFCPLCNHNEFVNEIASP